MCVCVCDICIVLQNKTYSINSISILYMQPFGADNSLDVFDKVIIYRMYMHEPMRDETIMEGMLYILSHIFCS